MHGAIATDAPSPNSERGTGSEVNLSEAKCLQPTQKLPFHRRIDLFGALLEGVDFLAAFCWRRRTCQAAEEGLRECLTILERRLEIAVIQHVIVECPEQPVFEYLTRCATTGKSGRERYGVWLFQQCINLIV